MAQSALAEGDLGAAGRWLDRATRLAPGDATLALARATLFLRQDAAQARAAYAALAARHDVREVWLGLAAAERQLGDFPAAARALGRAFGGHAANVSPDLFAATTATARDAREAGWCALQGDGTLSWLTARFGEVVISLDMHGQRAQVWARPPASEAGTIQNARLPASARLRARAVWVTCADQHLIGSPISLAAIRRVEGIATATPPGISGWAWHPADPETPVRLRVRAADGTRTVVICATGPAPELPGDAALLARRRTFEIPASALSGLVPPFAVTADDGVALLGSPCDPGVELREAAASALAVARRCPADLPAAPFEPGRPPRPHAHAGVATSTGIDIVLPITSRDDAAYARTLLRTLGRVDRLFVVTGADHSGLESAHSGPVDTRLSFLHLAQARGFGMLAEHGLRAAAQDRDVALIGEQVSLAPGWPAALSRKFRSGDAIGAVAPLAGSLERNGPRRAAHAGPGQPVTIQVPALASGCLLLRRACLEAVGGLRPSLFSQAATAIEDFCHRAGDLGWLLVVAPGVVAKFPNRPPPDPADRAIAATEDRLLSRLYPPIDRRAIETATAAAVRLPKLRAEMARWRRATEEVVVLVTHDRGGGVERQVRRRAKVLEASGLRPVYLRPAALTGGGGHTVAVEDSAGAPELRFEVPREIGAVTKLLRRLGPKHVELHHLLGHHPSMLALPRQLGVPYDVHVHDYACFCPRIALVSTERRHCNEPGAAQCEACVADLGRIIEEDIPVAMLRRRSAAWLADARRVIAPVHDVAARLSRHFPGLRAEVSAWEDDTMIAPPPGRPPKPGASRRVGVIGAIGLEKGYDVLLGCARDAATRRLNLLFIVVGHTIDDMRLIDTGRVFITGEYRDAEVRQLIVSQGCHLAFLPSVWPETWSFTLSEAWRAGLCVAAFDLGAPAERIRRSGHGWLLPLGATPQSVNNALVALA